jgi:hypothetical protein
MMIEKIRPEKNMQYAELLSPDEAIIYLTERNLPCYATVAPNGKNPGDPMPAPVLFRKPPES